uniref:LNR domain-containing protein n=1 Tax=Chaetoceros debilis TaxID=122233 RepID=A0A7S3Q2Y1_9STRA
MAVEGYDDCKVADPSWIGDGICDDGLPHYSEACTYDGGECPLPLPVEGYPDCFVRFPQDVGDGICRDSLPYNSFECGFDGDDCRPAEFAPKSSSSKSIQVSRISSFSSVSASASVIPSSTRINIPTSSPTLSQSPSVSPSISAKPSISAMPSTLNVLVKFELLTDAYPQETKWSLVNDSQEGAIVHSGPSVGEIYNANSLYSFTPWTLDRCTSYIFTIYDSWGDGLSSPGYATVKTEKRKVQQLLGKIDGNFFSEGSVSFNICNDEQILD